MKVEIWSDVVCPFCYIGKRKFENALVNFEGRQDVEIIWHSFQLDPDLKPVPGQTADEWLGLRKGTTTAEGKKMNDGMAAIAREVGLDYKFDIAIVNNTLQAHRLLHLSREYKVQSEMKESLFLAYYTQGKDIGDLNVLFNLGQKLNIPQEALKAMFDSDRFIDEVHQDQEHARQIGVQGVPFFVFNDKYAISGAQPTELFLEVLEKVKEESTPVQIKTDATGFCTPEGDCQ